MTSATSVQQGIGMCDLEQDSTRKDPPENWRALVESDGLTSNPMYGPSKGQRKENWKVSDLTGNPMYGPAKEPKSTDGSTTHRAARGKRYPRMRRTVRLVYLVNMAALVIYIAVMISVATTKLPAWKQTFEQRLEDLEGKYLVHGTRDENDTTPSVPHGSPTSVTTVISIDPDFRTARFPTPSATGCAGPTSLGGHFRNATFTTLGATGRAGPTSLGDHYHGQDHEKLVTLQNGIQLFTVPETGNYRIEVAGAAGGWAGQSDSSSRWYNRSISPSAGCRGAVMTGTFHLQKGEELKILVGQKGLETEVGFSAGGGGGTFVTSLDDVPYIIAGGGGGNSCLKTRCETCDGTTLTSGRAGKSDEKLFPGGSAGHGATEGGGGLSELGGGGGGLLTNGGSGWDFVELFSCNEIGGEGGYAFINGGKGGRGIHNATYVAEGGFGGGGGAHQKYRGSGGGGGYSGGGRGPRAHDKTKRGGCECGGGGGSFNNGTDPSGANGTNVGPGYAVVVRLFD